MHQALLALLALSMLAGCNGSAGEAPPSALNGCGAPYRDPGVNACIGAAGTPGVPNDMTDRLSNSAIEKMQNSTTRPH